MIPHTIRVRGRAEAIAVGKIVCMGRNYVDHISELNNKRPAEPMFFIKPATALCSLTRPIVLPHYSQKVRHELELALLIGTTFKNATPAANLLEVIDAYGVAIDVTLQDLQDRCKKNGHPWEIAKGFDGSCPVSEFVPKAHIANPQELRMRMTVNGEVRHDDTTQLMIWPIVEILAAASKYFTIEEGDLVLTGTPAGVGPLNKGDALEMEISGLGVHRTKVE